MLLHMEEVNQSHGNGVVDVELKPCENHAVNCHTS
jgi:hypothetical protein